MAIYAFDFAYHLGCIAKGFLKSILKILKKILAYMKCTRKDRLEAQRISNLQKISDKFGSHFGGI